MSMKLMLLINVKMPTIVVILAFISGINTASERIKAIKIFIFDHFSYNKQLKIHAKFSLAWKDFISSEWDIATYQDSS